MADWDWADVRVWGAALDDVERVEAFRRLEEMITAASLAGTAWHQPAKLEAERKALLQGWRLPAVRGTATVATATDALLERLAMTARAARRARRRGEAEPSFLRVMRGD